MIRDCALSFEKLFSYQFIMKISKSDHFKTLCVNFTPSDYFHLAGLHKLGNLRISGSKRDIFYKILADNSFCDRIESSPKYKFIEDRILLLSRLRSVLDKNFSIYSYKKNCNYWSKISADYLIKSKTLNGYSYLFLKERDGQFYVCASIFNDTRDYAVNLKPYKIIHKKFIKKRQD